MRKELFEQFCQPSRRQYSWPRRRTGSFAGDVIADGGLSRGVGGGFSLLSGSETFTGTNIYTGPTTTDAGATLAPSGTGSIATSAQVADNGTFDISATTAGASIVTLAGIGPVNLGAGH